MSPSRGWILILLHSGRWQRVWQSRVDRQVSLRYVIVAEKAMKLKKLLPGQSRATITKSNFKLVTT